MNSRERVVTTLNHEDPERVPVDLGGSVVSRRGSTQGVRPCLMLMHDSVP